MQTLYIPSPSFPPVDFIASLPWRKIGQTLLTALLTVIAICHALALRLRAHRGRVKPALVAVARFLLTLADKLPDSGRTMENKAKELAAIGLSERAIASRLNITRYAARQLLAA
jgi:hypothetical protein